MKKLLAYVQGNTNPVGIYGPVGWLKPRGNRFISIHLRLMETKRYEWLTLTSAYKEYFT